MREETKIVSQQAALKKYQYITHRGDGTCEVRVKYKDDGSEDPSCWNSTYRAAQEKGTESKEDSKEKSEDKAKKNTSSDKTGDPIWVKIVFSILPILEIFWIVKAVIGLVLWPFRCIFCCNCSYPMPSYNFTKW